MEGHCSTGQSPQWAVVPMEKEEEEEEEEEGFVTLPYLLHVSVLFRLFSVTSIQKPYKGRYNNNLLSTDKQGSTTNLISILARNFLSSKKDFIKE